MALDSRPVCQFAVADLKKNSTKLLIAMCVGIGLALYGGYVQSRTHSDPSYMSTLSMVSHWMSSLVGSKMAGRLMQACAKAPMKQAVPNLMMRSVVHPVVHYSAIMSGFINLTQIILLKVYCKSVVITNVIIGLSAAGLVLSAICMVGSFATCKTMCLTCLGIHHCFIIYYAMLRRRTIKNMQCPPSIQCPTSSRGSKDKRNL